MSSSADGRPVALQFGAGSVGLGFTGQLFSNAGYEVVFVDVDDAIIARLNGPRRYLLDLVGPTRHETLEIGPVRAIHGADRAKVVEETAGAGVICTAVGSRALAAVAPALGAGLAKRSNGINVILCENELGVAERLGSLLSSTAGDTWRRRASLVESVVSRMAPADRPPAVELVRLRAEDYEVLPVDADAWKPPPLAIPAIRPVRPFQSWFERKLFVHNGGHAAAAYAGAELGCTTMTEALADASVRDLAREAMQESAEALARRYGADRQELNRHIDDLLVRMANPALGDLVERVGRDPARKLGRSDRLTGAALLCLEQGVEPRALVRAIAAGMRYAAARPALEDPVAEGWGERTTRLCGLAPGEPLFARVVAALESDQS